MNILIITQKMDKTDAILGFFHRWVLEFAKNCERVTVICLYKGACALPENVKVFSLGKEEGASRLKYLARFYSYIFSQRKNYDYVFVHMNQMYVILGWIVWTLLRKKIGLWYAHGKTSFSLWCASRLSNIIFSSSPSGFRIKTKKLRVVGQGIDLDMFRNFHYTRHNEILTVGRISRIKNIHLLLDLINLMPDWKLLIVGEPITTEDKIYLTELHRIIDRHHLEEKVIFCGVKTGLELVTFYNHARVFINLSDTGSMDKVVLEAILCGCVTFTSNKAFHEYNEIYLENKDASYIYDKINHAGNLEKLAVNISESHSLNRLIPKILNNYE